MRHDGRMVVALISGVVVLIAALIAAFVNLRTKQMELAAKVDDRRAEAVQRGYALVLAATDLTWHYQCHLRLKSVGWDLPENWDTKWPRTRTRIDQTWLSGVDLLKQHSSHYDNVATVLNWSWQVVRENYTLTMMESKPDDYDDVRNAIVLCSRADARMSDPMKKKQWIQLGKANQPRDTADLTTAEALSRINAMLSAGQAGSYIIQDTSDDEEGNVILAYLKNLEEVPKLFVPSLAITEGRIRDWTTRGISTVELFCSSEDDACCDRADRKLEELSVQADD
jgi:hypothetical protein